MVNGLVLSQKISHLAGGVNRVEKAKIGLIQFCISPPKTDVSLQYFVCISSQLLIFYVIGYRESSFAVKLKQQKIHISAQLREMLNLKTMFVLLRLACICTNQRHAEFENCVSTYKVCLTSLRN